MRRIEDGQRAGTSAGTPGSLPWGNFMPIREITGRDGVSGERAIAKSPCNTDADAYVGLPASPHQTNRLFSDRSQALPMANGVLCVPGRIETPYQPKTQF